MEQQEVLTQLQSPNGTHEMGATAPTRTVPSSSGLSVESLKEKLEKMGQSLNKLRGDREGLTRQLEELDEGVERTEGAVLMLQSLIQEADPQAAQRMQG